MDDDDLEEEEERDDDDDDEKGLNREEEGWGGGETWQRFACVSHGNVIENRDPLADGYSPDKIFTRCYCSRKIAMSPNGD